METTRLSGEGQITIPKSLRDAHRWTTGQEFIAINFGDGILLKPKQPFTVTSLEMVVGCLRYSGEPKSLEDFEQAIRQGVLEQWYDRS